MKKLNPSKAANLLLQVMKDLEVPGGEEIEVNGVWGPTSERVFSSDTVRGSQRFTNLVIAVLGLAGCPSSRLPVDGVKSPELLLDSLKWLAEFTMPRLSKGN